MKTPNLPPVSQLSREDFTKLLDSIVEYFKSNLPFSNKENEIWISADEVMRILNIKSKTTLQKLRDDGLITFSNPMRKVILYDKKSVIDYLNKHAKKSF